MLTCCLVLSGILNHSLFMDLSTANTHSSWRQHGTATVTCRLIQRLPSVAVQQVATNPADRPPRETD